MSETTNTIASDAGITLNQERLNESVNAIIRVQTKLARVGKHIEKVKEGTLSR